MLISPLIVQLVLSLVENKFEIRISKYEAISNDKNSKLKNDKELSDFQSRLRPLLLFGAFEHLIFGFVSDFEFRASYFRFIRVREATIPPEMFSIFLGVLCCESPL